ncbi:hypothetical protein Fmac_000239 [Flemingia macrophylla]|uniref:Thaumatin-like protein 1 n=1 Tax=Flemingia macrophylla TaxID=520843 RepID=A0ABD1NDQ0_9FABA
MDQVTISFPVLLSLHLLLLASGAVSTTSFTFVNKCGYSVWPGILSNAGVAQLPITGFALQTGESKTITAPTAWGGRFWGRTLCTQDAAGKFSCLTGDCGTGKVECSGSGAAPPTTLAEFTLDGVGGQDFFDVSLVDGYNIAMVVTPQGGSGEKCTTTGCVGDVNGVCPSELRVMSGDNREGVACKSACEVFGTPQYCCRDAYGTADTCKPTAYSQIFKRVCPRAYSYAYDDKTATFTCSSAADYTVTFCPSSNGNISQKSWEGQKPKPGSSGSASPQLNNGTMVYVGAMDQSDISGLTDTHVWESQAIAGFISIAMAFWLLCRFY